MGCLIMPGMFVVTCPVCANGEEDQIDVAVNQLIQAADVYDEQQMRRLVEQIAESGQPAIPRVVNSLTHENANVRWQMVLVAQRMHLADTRLFSPLLVRAADADADVRGAAALALADLFPQRKETSGAIQQMTKDPQPLVRVQAYHAAWTIGKRQGVVAALVQSLQHRDWMTSQAAVRSLAKIGAPAVGELQALLQSPLPTTKVLAMRTLARIKPLPEEILDLTADLATSDDGWVRHAAIHLLVTSDGRIWPTLRKLSCHTDDAIRRDVIRAIANDGHCSAEVSRMLAGWLDDRDSYVVVSALKAMASQRRGDIPVSKMRQLLRHNNADVRAATVAMVSQFDRLTESLRPDLLYVAEHESVDYIRRHARSLLGQER